MTGGRRGVQVGAGALALVVGLWAIGGALGTRDPASSPAGPVAGSSLRVVPVAAVVGPDGARTAVPSDVVGWLTARPDVAVLGVRPFRGRAGSAGVAAGPDGFAVTVEYELAPDGVPPLRLLVGVPLFCGAGEAACSRLVPGVRVRTTFVHSGTDPPVLVESRWPTGVMPPGVRQKHREAVRGALAPILPQ